MSAVTRAFTPQMAHQDEWNPGSYFPVSIKDPTKPLMEQSKFIQAYELVHNDSQVPLEHRYTIAKECNAEILLLVKAWTTKLEKHQKIQNFRDSNRHFDWFSRKVNKYEFKYPTQMRVIATVSFVSGALLFFSGASRSFSY